MKAAGYRLKAIGNDIQLHANRQTGTLSGVIDMLERCAGIRFFWHDKIGTIMPKNERVDCGSGIVTR